MKGVVFDKDGTLFDFCLVWSQWCDRVIGELSCGDEQLAHSLAKAIGYNLTESAFTSGSLIVSGAANDTAHALEEVLPSHDFDSVNEVCKRQSAGLTLATVNNLIDTLDQLKSAGLVLGVATNDTEESAYAQLKECHILTYFDFISGCDSGYGSKPGAGMLHAFCQSTGLNAAQTAMVGDSLHDINAGIAAGVGLTIGVLTGPATRMELQGHADVVMDDISGLVQLLL